MYVEKPSWLLHFIQILGKSHSTKSQLVSPFLRNVQWCSVTLNIGILLKTGSRSPKKSWDRQKMDFQSVSLDFPRSWGISLHLCWGFPMDKDLSSIYYTPAPPPTATHSSAAAFAFRCGLKVILHFQSWQQAISMKKVGHCLKWAKIFRDVFHWWLRLDFEMETFQ